MRQALAVSLCAILIAIAAGPSLAEKYPEPSIYPTSWELDFKHSKPRRIVVGNTPYWYITYTVTNNTKDEQIFGPDFEMVTKDGKRIKSDHGIGNPVFQKIKAVEGNKFLEPATKIAGTIHIGEDQAKDGVAIWKEPEGRMGQFKIFVGGLSGEYVILKDDDGKPILDKDNVPVIVRKTLELGYAVRGDEFYPGRDPVDETESKWVMR